MPCEHNCTVNLTKNILAISFLLAEFTTALAFLNRIVVVSYVAAAVA